MQIEYTIEEGKLIETKTEQKQEVAVYNYNDLISERNLLLKEVEKRDILIAKCLELGIQQEVSE